MPGAWNDVPLSSLLLFNGTVLDSGYIKAETGSRDSFCSIPGLVLSGWLQIELTITPVAGEDAPQIFCYSTTSTGDPADGYGQYLTSRGTDVYHDSGPQSLWLGPGYEDWDYALDNGDDHCYIDSENAWISAVRWRTLSSRYDGLPPGPANDNFANSIALTPGVPSAVASSEFATHEPFEEALFGIYHVRSIWYHFDSGTFSGIGRISPTTRPNVFALPEGDHVFTITVADVLTGATKETLASTVDFRSTLNPFDNLNRVDYAYFNIEPDTRYYVRFFSDQEGPTYDYQVTLDLMVNSGMLSQDETFSPPPTMSPNDYLPEEPGVWVLDYVADVPPGEGVIQSLRLRQVNQLSAWGGVYNTHTVPFTLTSSSRVSFWANFTNPNNVGSGPYNVFVAMNDAPEGDPPVFNGFAVGHGFYGSLYAPAPYWTPPGWTRYEYIVEPGEYALVVRGDGAGPGGYFGPSSLEVAKFQAETLAFATLAPTVERDAAWGILREEP